MGLWSRWFGTASPVFWEKWDGQPAPWTGHAIPGDVTPLESPNLGLVELAGRRVLRVTVNPGDAVYAGDVAARKDRCELLLDQRTLGDFGPGSEWWYRWGLFVPQDFPDPEQTGLWTVAGQFHEQAAPGEANPKTVPSISCRIVTAGTDSLRVAYGLEGNQRVVSAPLVRGQWADLTWQIRWAMGTGGWAKFRLQTAGRTFSTSFSGPNLYTSQAAALRVGLYRGSDWPVPATVAYGPLSIARSESGLR